MSPTTDQAQRRTPLNRSQIAGFWGAWTGWTLDGMDSFIYALVLTPALTELLPRSGYKATTANVGLAGSILFALFLVGWGLSFIWGPIADRFGRTKVLAASIFTFAIFTGLSAAAQNVWELATFRFIAGIGIGGEWALAGTYVAEAWPEDRRKMGAGYLQTGCAAGGPWQERRDQDRILGHRSVVDRHHTGLPGLAGDRRAHRAQKDTRDLLCGDGGFDCRQLRRQLRVVQPLVAGTIRDARAGDGVCVLHVLWPVRRRGRELLARALHHSVGARDARRGAASVADRRQEGTARFLVEAQCHQVQHVNHPQPLLETPSQQLVVA
jgi:hypothetical protein